MVWNNLKTVWLRKLKSICFAVPQTLFPGSCKRNEWLQCAKCLTIIKAKPNVTLLFFQQRTTSWHKMAACQLPTRRVHPISQQPEQTLCMSTKMRKHKKAAAVFLRTWLFLEYGRQSNYWRPMSRFALSKRQSPEMLNRFCVTVHRHTHVQSAQLFTYSSLFPLFMLQVSAVQYFLCTTVSFCGATSVTTESHVMTHMWQKQIFKRDKKNMSWRPIKGAKV